MGYHRPCNRRALRKNAFVHERRSFLENLSEREDSVAIRAIVAVLSPLRTRLVSMRVDPGSIYHPRASRLAVLDLVDNRLFFTRVLRDDRALTSLAVEALRDRASSRHRGVPGRSLQLFPCENGHGPFCRWRN